LKSYIDNNQRELDNFFLQVLVFHQKEAFFNFWDQTELFHKHRLATLIIMYFSDVTLTAYIYLSHFILLWHNIINNKKYLARYPVAFHIYEDGYFIKGSLVNFCRFGGYIHHFRCSENFKKHFVIPCFVILIDGFEKIASKLISFPLFESPIMACPSKNECALIILWVRHAHHA
jgi:hypothetical protein